MTLRCTQITSRVLFNVRRFDKHCRESRTSIRVERHRRFDGFTQSRQRERCTSQVTKLCSPTTFEQPCIRRTSLSGQDRTNTSDCCGAIRRELHQSLCQLDLDFWQGLSFSRQQRGCTSEQIECASTVSRGFKRSSQSKRCFGAFRCVPQSSLKEQSRFRNVPALQERIRRAHPHQVPRLGTSCRGFKMFGICTSTVAITHVEADFESFPTCGFEHW
jgi:hypothetical protein